MASFLLIFVAISLLAATTQSLPQLRQGSSLSVENSKDILISNNSVFSAGFYPVGPNAFCFAVWFTNSINKTIAWIANRDQPINGKQSQLRLLRDGNLNLIDAGRTIVWSSNTPTSSSVHLELQDNGNLVLIKDSNVMFWQSFQSPMDTLLPGQVLTRSVSLVSSKSLANYSSGYYKLFFDNDNVLRMLYNGLDVSSVYWPDPGLVSWETGRSTYNDSRLASYDDLGHFQSTDKLDFEASDFGYGPQRRLTLDTDGNLRMYSLQNNGEWDVTWQADFQIEGQCRIHGLCGPNSLCEYVPDKGRKCSCLPGFISRNDTYLSVGCEPGFNLTTQVHFLELPHVDFVGYDYDYLSNSTFQECQALCRNSSDCKAFLIKFDSSKGVTQCFLKSTLRNGHRSSYFVGILYLKAPKNHSTNSFVNRMHCKMSPKVMPIERHYGKRYKNWALEFLLCFVTGVGAVELSCILLVWWFFFRPREDDPSAKMQDYVQAAAGFQRFTYAELKKATSNFSEEIGRGGSGVVYKGVLADDRIAAIKRLEEASQGEPEFLSEVNTIGRLNHINLIEMWGYCVEKKHRMLVFEFMESKSLAENLTSDSLDWKKRYGIAFGTARGLAYLHEECLEWVLHCDVKPQNILLDSNFNPKVADFGLSKLLSRTGLDSSSLSRIRGTRGYMAPEWVGNKPITSKVDVYSFGMVMLEMLTGKSPTTVDIVSWVREMRRRSVTTELWVKEIVDTAMVVDSECRWDEMKTLGLVALQCVEEDKDARPSMSQVVELLQHGKAD